MATNMYGPVNSQATIVSEFYGSINGDTALITKVYGPADKQLISLNLDTTATYTLITAINEQTFIEKFNSWVKDAGNGVFYNNEIQEIRIDHKITSSDNYYDFYLVGKIPAHPDFNKSYSISISGNVNTVISVAATWGITFSGNSEEVRDTVAATPEFSEVAKLVHQGFGHVDYGYGYVEYYMDSGHTATDMVTIRTTSELNGLGGHGDSDWSTSVEGVTLSNTSIKKVFLNSKVDSLPANFLRNCPSLVSVDLSGTTITVLSAYFCYGCTSLTTIGAIPSTVQSIGVSVLAECSSFNSVINIPSGVTFIGDRFLYNCTSFNQDITLPSSLGTLGSVISPKFMFGCESMTSVVNVGSLDTSIMANTDYYTFTVNNSSAPAFVTGIKIAGANRAAWMSYFPNRTSGSATLRRLIDAGY